MAGAFDRAAAGIGVDGDIAAGASPAFMMGGDRPDFGAADGAGVDQERGSGRALRGGRNGIGFAHSGNLGSSQALKKIPAAKCCRKAKLIDLLVAIELVDSFLNLAPCLDQISFPVLIDVGVGILKLAMIELIEGNRQVCQHILTHQHGCKIRSIGQKIGSGRGRSLPFVFGDAEEQYGNDQLRRI